VNVPGTQNSLFRQMDAAALVATLQNAADQAQRQTALSAEREAQHREASIQDSSEADASQGVGGNDQDSERRKRRQPLVQSSSPDKESIKEVHDPGPLGRHLDVTG
jgi:hypothetical protein